MAKGKRGKGGRPKKVLMSKKKLAELEKKKKEEAAAAAKANGGDVTDVLDAAEKEGSVAAAGEMTEGEKRRQEMLDAIVVTHAAAKTGASFMHSRDIKADALSLSFHGARLLEDTSLSLNYGQRYALIGPNGCGKSTLLNALGSKRHFECIPPGIDIYLVDGEIEGTDKTALQAVLEADTEKAKLEAEAETLTDILASGEELSMEVSDAVNGRLEDIYDRLDGLDASTAEPRAAEILRGLQFTTEMQNKKTREFSGGWRMRIALARALFLQPTALLLDEPTNHLDLLSVVWLEHYLSKWTKILLIISHSQDFLNGVCTQTIHFDQRNLCLTYYGGNYDAYIKVRRDLEIEQQKRYEWEQEQIAHMKDYIARFGHGSSKLAKQAQSKEKTLAKMIEKGLTKKVVKESSVSFKFVNMGKLRRQCLPCRTSLLHIPDASRSLPTLTSRSIATVALRS